MIRKTIKLLSGFCLGTMALLAGASAHASFPDRPITMLIGFAPGGGADTIGRIIAEKMSTILGQPIIVQNKPGANSTIAVQELVRAKPDGYTILLNAASLSIASAVYKNIPFDVDKDLAPISLLATHSYLLTVPAGLPSKTFKEFVDYAKSHKGEVNYGSSGIGSAPHMGMELFASATGLDMNHVPYKGSNPANIDLAAGRVSAMLTNYLGAAAMIQSNKFRILAVTSKERSAVLPDVPTMAELGYPNVEVLGWYSLDAPAGVPADIIDTISRAAAKAMSDPEMVKHLRTQDVVVVGSTPSEYRVFFDNELAKWKRVASQADISLD